MPPLVYVETSVISYLTARPSHDLILAAHQVITREWWDRHHGQFELYCSQLVVNEASAGDLNAARKRLEAIEGIPLLDPTDRALKLAELIIGRGLLPKTAAEDALHIAIATAHGMDYLLTWNCRHIANAEIRRQVDRFCTAQGLDMPIFVHLKN